MVDGEKGGGRCQEGVKEGWETRGRGVCEGVEGIKN